MLDYDFFNRWDLVAVDVIVFSLFLLSLSFKGRCGKLTGGLYLSFIISLFVEMYGFPLTIYFMLTYLGGIPFTYWKGHLLGFPGFILGFVILALGICLIISGWKRIYGAKGQLVTDGVYAQVRHPQYLGFILVTFGWLIHWPTLVTALLWPILTISYHRLAREEERKLRSKFGMEYQKYSERVSMFIPRIKFQADIQENTEAAVSSLSE